MTDPQDPAEALASIRDARSRMLDDMDSYPRAYDIWLSLAVGLMIAAQGLPDPWPLLSIPPFILFVIKVQAWWKARYGWWVDAYKPRKARWIAFGMLAIIMVLLGAAIWGRYQGPWWLCLAAGAVAWLVSVIGTRWWAAVWKRELRETT